ncbi:MAG: hypothetical protein ACE5R6_10125 [Candidatus Heimdallarchaeota archaeon]
MGARKAASRERIACYILEGILGFKTIETSKDLILSDQKVSEIDFIMESPEGELYAVEVKGLVSVGGLRQAYLNAELLGKPYKPLVICKDFSDKAAKELADQLKIRIVKLSDYFLLLGPEELELIVRGAMREILAEFGFRQIPDIAEVSEDDVRILEALAGAKDFETVARHLDMKENELGGRLGTLRAIGLLPRESHKFQGLQRHARFALSRLRIERVLMTLETKLTRVEEQLNQILHEIQRLKGSENSKRESPSKKENANHSNVF